MKTGVTGTTGHVLEGRYTGIVIDDTCYLRNAIGYVLRNPVEARLVSDAGDWPWSSYNAAMGKASPQFETVTWLRSLFQADTLDESRRLLAEHVRKEPEDYPDLVRDAAEGPHEFKKVRTSSDRRDVISGSVAEIVSGHGPAATFGRLRRC